MSQTLRNNDNFFERVYRVTRLIPYGRITTYGAIARYLGATSSARMVGWALNSSSSQDEWVPAHRVVNRKGLLTGKIHFPGSNTMQQLLEAEGIRVDNNAVVDFDKLFWDPNIELKETEFIDLEELEIQKQKKVSQGIARVIK